MKKTKAIAEAKIKTDRIDDRMLAHLKRAPLLMAGKAQSCKLKGRKDEDRPSMWPDAENHL